MLICIGTVMPSKARQTAQCSGDCQSARVVVVIASHRYSVCSRQSKGECRLAIDSIKTEIGEGKAMLRSEDD